MALTFESRCTRKRGNPIKKAVAEVWGGDWNTGYGVAVAESRRVGADGDHKIAIMTYLIYHIHYYRRLILGRF